MLILGSEKAVDHFRVGAKKGPVVLGQDLSLGKALGFAAVEDANIFASRDVISHSLADGAIVDWSLIGTFKHPLCLTPSMLHAGMLQACGGRHARRYLFYEGAVLSSSTCCCRTGGKISVDKDANAAIYGKDADLEKVLGAPSSTHSPPAALKPLYDTLDSIAADAQGDMRKFNGFGKRWNPDTSEMKAKAA